jgi:hypothetical protein
MCDCIQTLIQSTGLFPLVVPIDKQRITTVFVFVLYAVSFELPRTIKMTHTTISLGPILVVDQDVAVRGSIILYLSQLIAGSTPANQKVIKIVWYLN